MRTVHDITKIHNGAVYYYTGFKIETTLGFNKLCESINEKIEVVFSEYINGERMRLQKCMNDALSEAQIHHIISVTGYDELCDKEKDALKEIDREAPRAKYIEVTPTEKGIKFSLITELDEYLETCNQRRNSDFDHNGSVYGSEYVGSYIEFILPPFEVELVTGERELLESSLLLFKNNTAIIRTALSLKEVETDQLYEHAIDDYIVAITNPYRLPIVPESTTLSAVNTSYALFLFTMKKVSAILGLADIKNLVIAKPSTRFKHLEEASDKVKEDIYRIISAPVPEWEGISLKREIDELFNKRCYSLSGINYILNNMNFCLSIADGYLVDEATTKYGEEYISKNFVTDIRNGAEFALCILLLKCVNNRYSFHKRATELQQTEKIRKEYNENVIFIDNLQSDAWGSAREQVEAFEGMMAFFLDSKNIKEKMDAINSIFEGERNRRIISLQNTLSFIGIAVTLIFGLPAICETLKMINRLIFNGSQIPENVGIFYSLIIWIILLFLLVAAIFLKSEFPHKLKKAYRCLISYLKRIGKRNFTKK